MVVSVKLDDFPDEIIEIIFHQLDLIDRTSLMYNVPRVSKRFKALVQIVMKGELYFDTYFDWKESVILGKICRIFQDSVTYVNIGGDCVEDKHLMSLARNCPKLRNITIHESPKLMDPAVKLLAYCCPEITNVRFNGCLITDEAVFELADKCPGIKYANFEDCFELTDAALVTLAENCPNLRQVIFNWCEVTDDGVIAFAKKCPGLEIVSFNFCDDLTDAAVIALANNCPRITKIAFDGCTNLTDEAVTALADKCSGLSLVSFRGCLNLTDGIMITLADKFHGLRYYH